MIIVSLVCSTVLLGALFAVARSPSRTQLVLVMGVAAFFVPPFCSFFLPAVGLQVVFALLAAVLCGQRVAGASAFRRSMVAATVAGYSFAAMIAAREQYEMNALATKYPIESMTPRLAYETRHQESDRAAGVVQMSFPLGDGWDVLSRHQEHSFSLRRSALAQLHSSTVVRFLESPAFGVGRMTNLVNEGWLSSGDDPAVPQPDVARNDNATPEPESSAERGDLDAARMVGAGDRQLNAGDFWNAHANTLAEFVSPDRYGLIRSRDEVAGFLSHRIGPRADLHFGTALPPPERLELVSLLKFAEPRVYVSENLPRMDELRDALTRSLDPFEQKALESLHRGEDIVSTDQPGTMRALGAIRALKQCLQCHTTQEGQLLGAFSYRWKGTPVAPLPASPPRSAT
jgi:hypothetical protein